MIVHQSCLESKLLEEVSDSSLVSLLGDIVLVQIPSCHTQSTQNLHVLEGLRQFLQSLLSLLGLQVTLGQITEVELHVVTKG